MLNTSQLNQAGTRAPLGLGFLLLPMWIIAMASLIIFPSILFCVICPAQLDLQNATPPGLLLLRGVIRIHLPGEVLHCPFFITLLNSQRISLFWSRRGHHSLLSPLLFLAQTMHTYMCTHTPIHGIVISAFMLFCILSPQPENFCLYVQSQFPTGAIQCEWEKEMGERQ